MIILFDIFQKYIFGFNLTPFYKTLPKSSAFVAGFR